MTKQEQINKFLVEADGGCWHELIFNEGDKKVHCICGFQKGKWRNARHCTKLNPNFSKPENFIRLVEIVKKKELLTGINSFEIWWEIKVAELVVVHGITENASSANDILSTLSELIAKALGWKEAVGTLKRISHDQTRKHK